MKLKISFAGLALAFTSLPAFAHHPMSGATPSNFVEGLLSGVGHPVLGLDHLAFVIAMGVAAFMAGSRFMLPIIFVAATLVGTGMHLQSVSLPFVEVVIAASVVLIGLAVMSGKKISEAVYAGLFGISGLFHGHAYGEAIFGAESTPIVAYLIGFGVIQFLIAYVAGFVAYESLGKGKQAFENIASRLTGGMVAGAGMLLIGETAISSIFG